MAFPQAFVSYPGLLQYESCTATMAIGKTPGVILLRIPPQDDTIARDGDLTLTLGRTKITFVDCHADSSSFQYDDSGMVVSLNLKDFRWKWQFPTISGVYNLRDENAQIVKREGATPSDNAIQNSEYTPQDLARLCLRALGVRRFNVSRMPNEARPFVDWYFTNAADALQEVCDAVGCVICPHPDGFVDIREFGDGAKMPIEGIEQFSNTYDPPELPSGIKVACGPTRFQADLRLEAIGKDKDGKWKPIDELTYKPTGGWENNSDVDYFTSIANTKLRELAISNMYRAFRVRTPCKIPGFGEVKFPEQLILEAEQVATAVSDSRVHSQQAIAFGHWDNQGDATSETVAQSLGLPTDDSLPNKVGDDLEKLAQIIVPSGLSIDTDSAGVSIIRFNEQIYQTDSDGKIQEPVLFLRCATNVRDPETRAPISYERLRTLDRKQKTEPRCVVHSEITLTYIGSETNRNDVDKECDYYLDALEKEYRLQEPQTAPYVGLIDIKIDGAIQSITWVINDNGPTTIINRNHDDGSPVTVPYRQRYRNERNKRLIDEAYNQTSNYFARQVRGLSSITKNIPGA